MRRCLQADFLQYARQIVKCYRFAETSVVDSDLEVFDSDLGVFDFDLGVFDFDLGVVDADLRAVDSDSTVEYRSLWFLFLPEFDLTIAPNRSRTFRKNIITRRSDDRQHSQQDETFKDFMFAVNMGYIIIAPDNSKRGAPQDPRS